MKWGPEHPMAYAMRALIFAAMYRPLDNSPLTTVSIIIIIIMIAITIKRWK